MITCHACGADGRCFSSCLTRADEFRLERVQAVIDAARAHVNDPEVDLPDDWNVPHTPTFAALLDAVRALDGKTND